MSGKGKGGKGGNNQANSNSNNQKNNTPQSKGQGGNTTTPPKEQQKPAAAEKPVTASETPAPNQANANQGKNKKENTTQNQSQKGNQQNTNANQTTTPSKTTTGGKGGNNNKENQNVAPASTTPTSSSSSTPQNQAGSNKKNKNNNKNDQTPSAVTTTTTTAAKPKANQNNTNNNQGKDSKNQNANANQQQSKSNKNKNNKASSGDDDSSSDNNNDSEPTVLSSSSYVDQPVENEWVSVGKRGSGETSSVQKRTNDAQAQLEYYNNLISDQQSKLSEYNSKILEISNSSSAASADSYHTNYKKEIESLEKELFTVTGGKVSFASTDSLTSRNYTTGDRALKTKSTYPAKLREKMLDVEDYKLKLATINANVERIKGFIDQDKDFLAGILARTPDYVEEEDVPEDKKGGGAEGGIGTEGGEGGVISQGLEAVLEAVGVVQGKGKEKEGEDVEPQKNQVVSGGVGDGVREADGELNTTNTNNTNTLAQQEASVPGQ